jgi:hypothetical protein
VSFFYIVLREEDRFPRFNHQEITFQTASSPSISKSVV